MHTRGQNSLSFRCPYCLWRDMDIVLLYDANGYYCIKCAFEGTVEDINRVYAEFQSRYRLRNVRLTESAGSSSKKLK